MKPKGHAVLLHPNTPSSLLAMMKNYIHVYGEITMIFSSSVSYEAYGFLEILAIPDDKKREKCRVSIPSQYILAIADVQTDLGNEAPLGFRP
jgi:hypothetical protein